MIVKEIETKCLYLSTSLRGHKRRLDVSGFKSARWLGVGGTLSVQHGARARVPVSQHRTPAPTPPRCRESHLEMSSHCSTVLFCLCWITKGFLEM